MTHDAKPVQPTRNAFRWSAIRSFVLPRAEEMPRTVEAFEAYPLATSFVDAQRPRERSDLTALFGVRTSSHVALAMRCREPQPDVARSSPEGVEIWKGDHADICLDWTHSHRDYLHVIASPGGRIETEVMTASAGNLAWDGRSRALDVEIAGLDCRVERVEGAWWLVVRVPVDSLKGASGVTMGLMASRKRTAEFGGMTVLASMGPGSLHRPAEFADLYLVDRGVRVRGIDLDGPTLLEPREARIELENLSDGPRDITVVATTYCSADNVKRPLPEKRMREYRREVTKEMLPPAEEGCATAGVVASRAAGDEPPVARGAKQTLRVPYAFAPEDQYFMRVGFRVTDSSGEAIYEGSHDFGFDVAHMITYLKRDDRAPAASPDPRDPDFIAKKRLFFIHAFPRFERKTTAQCAQSDFVIEAADASARFDLMKPDALERMADYVRERFDNDEDRLQGCAFLVHQPAFITYTLGRAQALSGTMTPLAQMRFGSGQCGTFASVCLGIVERLAGEDGGRFEGAILNTPGHTMTTVRRHGGWIALDPALGNLYYVADNSRTATVDELIADPRLAFRSCPHAEHYFRDRDRIFFETHAGATFPEGAPRGS